MTRAATLFAVLQALASIQSNPVEAAAAHFDGAGLGLRWATCSGYAGLLATWPMI